MQSHHTKQAKKVNSLQCTRCQEELPNLDELKGHELNVDCPIRCLNCHEQFDTKALRQEHQKQTHFEEEDQNCFMELDDVMWKQVKDNLKAYSDSLKRGKGRVDPKLTEWVEANTARYEVGRSSKAKANAKLELGQWYTIFKTLTSGGEILEHPCEYPSHIVAICH